MNRRQVLLAGAAGLAAPLAKGEASSPPAAWRAGTGIAEITPPLDVGILMSSGRRAWAPFEGVRAPLHARAMIVEAGGNRVAVVALDLLGLAGEAVGGLRAFKEQIVAAAADAGLDAQRLALLSSHTHSGPESLALSDLYRTPAFQQWTRLLATRIADALSQAARQMRTARLVVGDAPAPGLAENRRIRTGRGITVGRLLRPDDAVYGPEGPVDDRVRVLAFLDPADRPLAMLVHATAHPVYEMCIKQVAPDYPGELCRLLESRYPRLRALFVQGAAGDVNPPAVSSGAVDAGRHGAKLAAYAEDALRSARPVEGSELAIRWRTAELPARELDGKPRREPLAARIGALRLGRSVLVLLPGEPFQQIGMTIAGASPFAFTIVAGYCDDYIGYIPTDRAFANGGYEIGPGRWSRSAAGAEPAVCRAAGELLQELRSGRSKTSWQLRSS